MVAVAVALVAQGNSDGFVASMSQAAAPLQSALLLWTLESSAQCQVAWYSALSRSRRCTEMGRPLPQFDPVE